MSKRVHAGPRTCFISVEEVGNPPPPGNIDQEAIDSLGNVSLFVFVCARVRVHRKCVYRVLVLMESLSRSKHSKSDPVVFNEEGEKQAADIFIRANYCVQSQPSHSVTTE